MPRPNLLEEAVRKAILLLDNRLVYHEHDGHDMPKRATRDAIAILQAGLKAADLPPVRTKG